MEKLLYQMLKLVIIFVFKKHVLLLKKYIYGHSNKTCFLRTKIITNYTQTHTYIQKCVCVYIRKCNVYILQFPSITKGTCVIVYNQQRLS